MPWKTNSRLELGLGLVSAGSMALNQRPVFADKVIIYVLYFNQFVVYTMRNPVICRTAKKVVFC